MYDKSLKIKFFRYIIPSVLAQWVYALYTMVDGMFVARGVNEIALTAVNLSNPFIQFLFALSLMFAVGTSTVASILLGERKNKQASEIFTQNAVVQVALAAIIVIAIMGNLDGFARFLGAKDPQTLQYVRDYLRNIVPFSAAFLLSYTFEITLKTDGFPRKSVVIVTIGAIENCILDWLFVIVLGKGVSGAAFATSLSQSSVIALYLCHFLSGKGILHFCKFKFSVGALWREIKNGFSSGLTEMSAGIITFLFNQTILLYLSRDALVSYTVISYVNGLVVLSATGIAQGAQPLISYAYGEKDQKKCTTLLRYSLSTAAVFCVAAFAITMLLANQLVSLYVGADMVQLHTYTVRAFRIVALSFLIVGFNITISGYLTAVERAIPAVCISMGRGLVLMAGSLMVLSRLFAGPGIWWAPLLSEGLCLLMSILLLAHHKKLVRTVCE